MYKKTSNIFIIMAVVAINLFFGLPRIAHYSAVDETLWSYGRVPKFWRNVANTNWRGTNLCDKPGITLAIISGTGLPFAPDPKELEDLLHEPKTPEQLNAINNLYFSLRLPVYIFSLLSLFFFYFLLKRLLSEKVALFATIFIGLSPILLGISLIINTDAILWILMPLALISFLIYQKEANQKFLYLSGFILGLAILDKFVANLLFPFSLVLIFVKYIFSNFENNKSKIKYFQKALRDYLLLIAISLLTIFVFYPSAWIKPKELLNTTIYSLALSKIWPLVVGAIAIVIMDVFILKSIISRKLGDFFSTYRVAFVRGVGLISLTLVIFVTLDTYWGMKFANIETILANPKPDGSIIQEFFPKLISAFFPLIYGLIPLISSLFISTIFFLSKITTVQIKKNTNIIFAFSLLLFILVFYIANSISRVSSTVRYQIITYPIASIIAAIGLYEIIKFESIKKYHTKKAHCLLIIFIFIFSINSLIQIKPFFLAYSSALLPNKYILNLRDDMGDGSWEVSQYLNSLPDAKELVVWSDKKQVCEKFIGHCETGFKIKNYQTIQFDYFVASTSGQQESQSRSKKDSTLILGGQTINVAKLYSNDDINYVFKIIVSNSPNNYIGVLDAKMAIIK